MCFHNTVKKKPKEVAKHFNVETEDDLYSEIFHGNGFTFLDWPIVSMWAPDVLCLKKWGLVPSWVKSNDEMKKIRSFNLNARCETAFEKPSFRNGIQHSRCLVPSTGFIEWREINKKKFPYFISLKKTELFAMAGIAESWLNKETGEVIETFSILTTEANETMSMIHNTKKRMPVILKKEDEKRWLNHTISKDEIQQLCLPYADDEMQYYTINPLVSSRNAPTIVKEVLDPYTYPELNLLF
jgi:putative SOS response-associated peptidase YedK